MARGIAQWVRVLATLAEDLSWVSSTHMAAYNCIWLWFQKTLTSGFHMHTFTNLLRSTYNTHIHTCTQDACRQSSLVEHQPNMHAVLGSISSTGGKHDHLECLLMHRFLGPSTQCLRGSPVTLLFLLLPQRPHLKKNGAPQYCQISKRIWKCRFLCKIPQFKKFWPQI